MAVKKSIVGQIENRNFLVPTGFNFILNRAPKVAYFGSSVEIPSMSLGVANFANYLKDEYKCEIVAYFNYCLLSAPLKFNILNSTKWFLGEKFSLKNFGIYRSFNTKSIFRPIINSSTILRERFIISIWPKVIGSKVPG